MVAIWLIVGEVARWRDDQSVTDSILDIASERVLCRFSHFKVKYVTRQVGRFVISMASRSLLKYT